MLWFRLADVALKATSFTFGTVLCIYLLGMAAGTVAGVPVARRVRDPLRVFLRCQAGILVWAGAAVVALAPPAVVASALPDAARRTGAPRGRSTSARTGAPGTLLLLYVAVPAFLYGVPTFLMGLSFAVLQRAVHDDARTSGRKVGLLQACNIAGCVAGTLVVGLGALGWWGTTGTLRALMVAGLVFVAVMARRRPLAWDTVALGGALVALAATSRGSATCGFACTATPTARPSSRKTRRAWRRSSRRAAAGACG